MPEAKNTQDLLNAKGKLGEVSLPPIDCYRIDGTVEITCLLLKTHSTHRHAFSIFNNILGPRMNKNVQYKRVIN
jgi:hypothetical protein